MRRDETLLLDGIVAVVIAVIVLVVSPGAAVDAILVLVLLVIVGIGALVSRGRDRGVVDGLRRWRGARTVRRPARGAAPLSEQLTPAERAAQRDAARRKGPSPRR